MKNSVNVKVLEDGTYLRFDMFYRWGVGFLSNELMYAFNQMVANFCTEHEIEYKEPSRFSCATAGEFGTEHYIHFHAMEIVFKGEYTKYVDLMKEYIENYDISEVI